MDNPKNGMRVKIIHVGDTKGMFIKKHHLDVRQIGQTGTLTGYVPGHGGDVWWIQHDSGSIGAYTIDEFEEIKNMATKQEKIIAKAKEMEEAHKRFLQLEKEYLDVFYNTKDD